MKAPTIREEVARFHREQIVIDLHVDVIIQQRLFRYDIRRFHRPWMRRQPFFRHADIPRMLEGGYSGAALGIHYWPRETPKGWREVSKQLDYLEAVVAADARVLRARTAADIETAHAEGRLALLAGFEGAHLLGGNIDRVEEIAERGGLYLTLAHFSKNAAATPGMGRGKNQVDGLTPWGHDLVRKLEDCRVLVDVAHVNGPGVLDACRIARNPVICTHTTAATLFAHPRGVVDEGLRAIATTGGVIAIIFSPQFLTGRLNASLDAVVDHVLHVRDCVGAEHLALGTDFDGWIPTIPNDIRDCRDLDLLTQKLLDRGMGRDEVAGMLGANLLRVIRQVRGA